MMNAMQQAAFDAAMAEGRACLARGDLDAAHAFAERAHVLGQAHVAPHVRSHALMLRVEWHRARYGAVVGQAVRIVLGALGSAVGVVPTGNTGGSDVNMFRRMPIDPALQRLIDGPASGASRER